MTKNKEILEWATALRASDTNLPLLIAMSSVACPGEAFVAVSTKPEKMSDSFVILHLSGEEEVIGNVSEIPSEHLDQIREWVVKNRIHLIDYKNDEMSTMGLLKRLGLLT